VFYNENVAVGQVFFLLVLQFTHRFQCPRSLRRESAACWICVFESRGVLEVL